MRARGPALGVAAVLILLAALGACARTPAASTRCRADAACDAASACVAGVCLPRLVAPASWAVELTPAADPTAAFTELPDVALGAAPLALTASATTVISGMLTLEPLMAPLGAAHVLLTVPAGITGRPSLLFETDLPPGGNAAAPTFSLSVPMDVLGRTGTVLILPAAPDDATHGPSTFALAVAPTMTATLAAKSFAVTGRLRSAAGDGRGGLVARAYRDDTLVSTAATTADDGTFTLMVPAALVAPTDMIVVRLEPAATDTVDPRYSSKPFSLSADMDLGDLSLPAFEEPNAFRLFVLGGAADGPGIASALVRTYNTVTDDAGGTTDFLRDGVTNTMGYADLALLPGSTTALRQYTIAVVPPASAPYATACFTAFPIAGGGSTSHPANVPALVLPPRVGVTGTVRGDDGAPVSGVTVVATAAVDATSPCAALAGTPAPATNTDDNGAYQLFLDPGTYTFDFDPPEGAPVPRTTETAIPVAAAAGGAPLTHDVRLPPGALLEGTTAGPDGRPLPLAGVSFYASVCPAPCAAPASAVPTLQATTHSDATGAYRTVLPVVPTATGSTTP